MHRFISTSHRQLITASFATMAVTLAFAPAAFGSASSAQTYNPGGNKVIDVAPETPPDVPPTDVPPTDVPPTDVPPAGADAATPAKSGLAFTGLSLGLIAGAGVLLLGLGVGTRRLVSTRLS